MCCFSWGKKLRGSFLPDPRPRVLQRKSLGLLKLFFCRHSHCSKVLLVIFQHLLMSCLINNPAQSFQALPTPPLASKQQHQPWPGFSPPQKHFWATNTAQGVISKNQVLAFGFGMFLPSPLQDKAQKAAGCPPSTNLREKTAPGSLLQLSDLFSFWEDAHRNTEWFGWEGNR